MGENETKAPDPLVPLKIRTSTWRLIKTLAAWKGISAWAYLDDLVAREATPDLVKMAEEVADLAKKARAKKSGT